MMVKYENPVTLRYNLGSVPQSLDPGVGGDWVSAVLHEQLFRGLLFIDPKSPSSEVKPDLAISWEVSEDGLIWTFRMRDDVHWVCYDPSSHIVAKKRPVNAYDIEYAVKRVADPATGANWAFLLYHIIRNFYEVNVGVPGFTIDDVGVKALDSTTVQFILEKPAAYFTYIIALQTTRPVPREPIEIYGDKWVEPGKIWTNGPYLLDEYRMGDKLVLVKNPFYENADQVQIERLNLFMITSLSTQLALYEANALDSIEGLPPDEIDRIKQDPVLSKQLRIMPNLSVQKVEFVNTKPPFDDPRVRQAFSAAIDRETLCEKVLRGGQMPATTYAPPGIFGAVPPEMGVGQGYDPALAKAKLQEYLDEKGMTLEDFNRAYKITFGCSATELNRRIQQAIAAMWKEVLGIEVILESQEWTVYVQTCMKFTPVEETFHIHLIGWSVDYPDQSNYISWYKCDHENMARRGCADPNCQSCRDTEFDRIIAEADACLDPTRRQQLYWRAEQILFEEEFAFAPIYWGTSLILTKPWLQRDFPPLRKPNFKDWRIDVELRETLTGR
ncbi:peptide ABC transporter substrate-binding protein [Candidatus Hadarchaeum sp.]|uniref:peptide ABC transporter substrate-binding protein n=1 Tax=Candidatus Hadarchaeum sp. TaxID=2883567 RepID=UPI00319E97EA